MNRASSAYRSYNHNEQPGSCRSVLAPLTIWICVLVTVQYGYYGDYHIVLIPNTSRLFKASSIFVEKIEVKDTAKQGLVLYEFPAEPKLNIGRNWNISNILIVGINHRRGISLWLNKGSTILVTWKSHINDFHSLSIALIKGEDDFVTVQPLNSLNLAYGNCGRATFVIEEDDKYFVSAENKNLIRSIIMEMNVEVSPTIYDTSTAKRICSTINGLCQFKVVFPTTQYLVLTTPNSDDINGLVVELSFVARFISYIAVLLVLMMVLLLIMKCLASSEEQRVAEEISVAEARPLVPEKAIKFTYGTNEEDEELGKCGSSEDLYKEKICVICYDEQRNCFFVPCGHCATCYECAQRIMDVENKVCPICRRLIHRVRRMTSP